MERPCLAPFPLQVGAPQDVAEHLAGPGLEQVPRADQVKGGVGGAEAPDVKDAGKAPAGH
jgi:hypothetical protein